MPAIVLSKVPAPLRVLRLASCSSRGPSMLTPTPTFQSRNSAHQSSSISMPLVWKACRTTTDGGRSRSIVGEGLAIEGGGHDERLAGMPDHRELRRGPARGEQLGEQPRHRRLRQDVLVVAIGQVAVAAVDVAEGGRLKHDHFDSGVRRGHGWCRAHQLCQPLCQPLPQLCQPPLPQLSRPPLPQPRCASRRCASRRCASRCPTRRGASRRRP